MECLPAGTILHVFGTAETSREPHRVAGTGTEKQRPATHLVKGEGADLLGPLFVVRTDRRQEYPCCIPGTPFLRACWSNPCIQSRHFSLRCWVDSEARSTHSVRKLSCMERRAHAQHLQVQPTRGSTQAAAKCLPRTRICTWCRHGVSTLG